MIGAGLEAITAYPTVGPACAALAAAVVGARVWPSAASPTRTDLAAPVRRSSSGGGLAKRRATGAVDRDRHRPRRRAGCRRRDRSGCTARARTPSDPCCPATTNRDRTSAPRCNGPAGAERASRPHPIPGRERSRETSDAAGRRGVCRSGAANRAGPAVRRRARSAPRAPGRARPAGSPMSSPPATDMGSRSGRCSTSSPPRCAPRDGASTRPMPESCRFACRSRSWCARCRHSSSSRSPQR